MDVDVNKLSQENSVMSQLFEKNSIIIQMKNYITELETRNAELEQRLKDALSAQSEKAVEEAPTKSKK